VTFAVFKAIRSCLLAFAVCTSAFANDTTLRLGVVPQFDARHIQAVWQPILDYLELESGIHIELAGSPSIPAFEKQLMAGTFDLAYMNPYHLLKAHEAQRYQPLVRDTGRTLFGIIVVRKDSTVQGVQELDGKTVAFPAPNALGASLIPRAVFSESYHISVIPKYVRSHSSVYLNVVTGQTDAGGGVERTFEEQPPAIRDALRVIYTTPKVAPHPVAVHPRVAEDVQNAIREAFLMMAQTSQGRELLAQIPVTQMGRATLADYTSLLQLGLEKYYVE